MAHFSGLRLPFLFLLCFGLAACRSEGERPNYPELTWTHLPPITLDVAEIEIIDNTAPSKASPHVEQLFPVPPSHAAQRWARDRLRAGGLANRARFIIQRADVTGTSVRCEITIGDTLGYPRRSKIIPLALSSCGRAALKSSSLMRSSAT